MLRRFAVLVVLLGAMGCDSRPSPAPSAWSCAPAAPPSPAVVPAPAGDGLVVAEQGFSRVEPWSFSLGAIVSNATARAAYRTTVALRLLDPAGGVVLALPPRTLPMVLPGERLPVGVAVDLPADRAAAVARLAVELGTTHWVDAEADNRLFRRYDTVGETDAPNPAPSEDADRARRRDFHLPADMGAHPCEGLSATSAALVFRDAAGTLIGGEAVAYSGEYCAGSHFGDTLSAKYVPRETDLKRTQIAVYCEVPG
jgi:hypothetical protein